MNSSRREQLYLITVKEGKINLNFDVCKYSNACVHLYILEQVFEPFCKLSSLLNDI